MPPPGSKPIKIPHFLGECKSAGGANRQCGMAMLCPCLRKRRVTIAPSEQTNVER